jgi:hypothetical protein
MSVPITTPPMKMPIVDPGPVLDNDVLVTGVVAAVLVLIDDPDVFV